MNNTPKRLWYETECGHVVSARIFPGMNTVKVEDMDGREATIEVDKLTVID